MVGCNKQKVRCEVSDLCKFLDKHIACLDGRDWALASGASTCAEIWVRSDLRPAWRVWMATRLGVLDHRTLVRFAVFCARQSWENLTDDRSKNAILLTEKWLAGEASLDEVAFIALVAGDAAAYASDAARAASAAYAARAASVARAAYAAARAASAAAYTAAYAAADAAADAAYAASAAASAASAAAYADAYAADAAADAAYAAADAAYAAACAAQGQWLIENTTPNWEL